MREKGAFGMPQSFIKNAFARHASSKRKALLEGGSIP